jgi:alpha-1,6-mannosyltransferase
VPATRTLIAWATLGVAHALLLLWGGAQDGDNLRQLMATLGGAALGGAALLWLAFDERFERVPLLGVFTLALLLRAIAAFASPLLEDDHYRYLWDGWRSATALDAYRLPPAAWFGDASLHQRWQDVLSAINHPELPTIYGPVLQVLFAIGHLIAPMQLWPLQGLLLAADLLLLWLLARQGVGARWLLAYAMHPLVLKEAMASAHPDALLALFLLLTLIAWQRGRAMTVGVWLGVAVATKVAALVVLPLLLWAPMQGSRHDGPDKPHTTRPWALIVVAACITTVALLYGPFIVDGRSDATALAIFGTTWRFNPLLYRIVEAALPTTAARPAAALLILAGVAIMCWRWRQAVHQRPNTLPPLDAALVLLLLLSPVVNPWYWLWPLALAVSRRSACVVAIAAVSVLSYLNSSVITLSMPSADAPTFWVPWPLALAQVLVFLVVWRLQHARQAPMPTPRVSNVMIP